MRSIFTLYNILEVPKTRLNKSISLMEVDGRMEVNLESRGTR